MGRTGGDSGEREAPREEASDEATMALARESMAVAVAGRIVEGE